MLSKDTSSDELLSFDLQQPDNPNSEGLLIFCRQLFEQGILQLDSGDYPFATAKLTGKSKRFFFFFFSAVRLTNRSWVLQMRY